MKYYAVRKGRSTGIFIDWLKCQESVKGYKGAEFKSFTDETSAKLYLTKVEETEVPDEITSDFMIAYIDGSYNSNTERYGSGLVVLDYNKHIQYTKCFSDARLDAVSMRNIAGEVQAALLAMEYAQAHGFKKLIINYDYEGIAKWCNGMWQANKTMTKYYQDTYNHYKKNIKIYFNKIDAHTGEVFNELADQLAKYSIGLTDEISILAWQVAAAVQNMQDKLQEYLYEQIDIRLATQIAVEFIQEINSHLVMSAELASDICIGETRIRVKSSNYDAKLILPIRFSGNTVEIGDYLYDM